MADQGTPTDTTHPLAAGHTTTEYAIARTVTFLTAAIAVLSSVGELVGKVQAVIPEAPKGLGLWVALGAAAVGGLTSVAYGLQRTLIKIEAIKAGTTAPDVSAAAANLGAK